MWVKTERGTWLNLDRVEAIRITTPPSGGYAIEAFYGDGRSEEIRRIQANSREEAQGALDEWIANIGLFQSAQSYAATVIPDKTSTGEADAGTGDTATVQGYPKKRQRKSKASK